MSRLEELLRDASEPDDLWSLDPSAIAHEGRRRVVRKRWTRVGAVAAAVVVTAGVAVGVPLLQGARNDRVTDAPARGEYRDVVLSRAEMERRCTDELNERNGTDVPYVAGRAPDGTAVPSTGRPGYVETREGWAVQLIPEGDTWPKGMPLGTKAPTGALITEVARRARLGAVSNVCLIPQSGMTPGVDLRAGVPRPSDHAAIIADCSRAAGYDFDGWRVEAAINNTPFTSPPTPQWLDAVLLSSDGHEAQCWLRPDRTSGMGMVPRPYLTLDGQPLLEASDTDPSKRYAVVAPVVDPAMGIGIVPGLPDGWRIDVLADGMRIATVTTDGGGFAYSLEATIVARRWRARVFDASGEMVWQGRLDTDSLHAY
ncbi:hypothetical protein [Nocardioides panacisoli]|uniref:Uncharacterized protein n=1 Tax=Nocardioides panacisoli TaxID=627624 RepID=A0ABP7IJC0_9ACTN